MWTERRWDPARTRVFAVGILRYEDGVHWPLEGRRDAVLMELLARRGVPAEKIVFVRDEEATGEAVRERFRAHLEAATDPDELLWVYFAGHGSRSEEGGCFVLYDDAWQHPELFAAIERYYRGRAALLTADCCFSGNLAVDAPKRAGRVAYAALTSSLSTSVSTGAWTFTDSLVEGLEGKLAIDEDGDGALRLDELAAYVERKMARCAWQLSSFVVANGFPSDFVLGAAEAKGDPRVGEVFEARSEGQWYRVFVLAVEGSRARVHWENFDDSYDSWEPLSSLRPWTPTRYAPGTEVELLFEEQWYAGSVLAERSGMHLVRYDDYGADWDEWVSPERLRAR